MSSKKQFSVIFDLDGTLIDTPRGIVETFTETLRLMGARGSVTSFL